MKTVASITESLIEAKPFLQEALSRGIINHAALADELLPAVEEELKEKVTFSAVNMAIRRFSEKMKKTLITTAHFDQRSSLTIQSGLFEVTVFKDDVAWSAIKKVHDVVNLKQGDFLTTTQGIHEIMLIANQRHERKILDILSKATIKKTIRRLSSVTISIPEQSYQTIGLFYLASRTLNWQNINIVDIVSTFTEMTFIIKEEDTGAAFCALNELIHPEHHEKPAERRH